MRQKSGTGKAPAEQLINDIRRATRKRRSADDRFNRRENLVHAHRLSRPLA